MNKLWALAAGVTMLGFSGCNKENPTGQPMTDMLMARYPLSVTDTIPGPGFVDEKGETRASFFFTQDVPSDDLSGVRDIKIHLEDSDGSGELSAGDTPVSIAMNVHDPRHPENLAFGFKLDDWKDRGYMQGKEPVVSKVQIAANSQPKRVDAHMLQKQMGDIFCRGSKDAQQQAGHFQKSLDWLQGWFEGAAKKEKLALTE